MKEVIAWITAMVEYLFKDNYGNQITLTPKQAIIVKKIVFLESPRLVIAAYTGYGKTYVVAIALFLCAIVNPGIRIGIISCSKKQSSLCYDYILGFISREPKLWELVGAISRDMKDLVNALNRERLSVGNDEIKSSIGIFTANLHAQGSNLLGLHFDLVVEDESVLIPDELEKTKILRMLEKGPNDVMSKSHVKISTTHDLNHFKKWFDNPEIDKVVVTAEDGFIEGRLTRDFINTQKEELGELFPIWYMCEFPELGSDKLFTYKEINCLLVDEVLDKNLIGDSVISVDVARFGTNNTVISIICRNDFGYFIKCLDFYRGKDTVYTYGNVKEFVKKWNVKTVIVDDCGVGGGVTDMLRNDVDLKVLKVNVIAFNAGKKCKNKKDSMKYVNQGTKSYLFLKELIRKDLVVYERNKFIMEELENITKEFTTSGQLRVFKKGTKLDSDSSPDFCFIGDTKVLTTKGNVCIKDVKVGDKVITPFGFRKVLNKSCRLVDDLVEVKTNCNNLITTPNHKIYNKETFKYAKDLLRYDKLSSDSLWNLLKFRIKNLLNIKERNIGFRAQVNTSTQIFIKEMEKKEEQKKDYIDKYGKIHIIKQFLKDLLYIMLMEIPLIIILKILNFVGVQNTKENILLKVLKKVKLFLNLEDKKKQKNGIKVKKEKNGIKIIGKKVLEKLNIIKFVKVVIKNLYHQLKIVNIVPEVVGIKNIKSKKIKVYNLTVEKDGVYYANGLLVSNCDSAVIGLSNWWNNSIVISVNNDFELNPDIEYL